MFQRLFAPCCKPVNSSVFETLNPYLMICFRNPNKKFRICFPFHNIINWFERLAGVRIKAVT